MQSQFRSKLLTETNMEVAENVVENGKCDEDCDTVEQQSDVKSQSLLMEHEADFEARFIGNDGMCSGDEYDENDEETFSNR